MPSSTVDKILDAALHLYAERGLHATPTSAITKAAGVSTGLLFHHFGGKEELTVELYAREKLRLYAAMREGAEKGLYKGVRSMVLNSLDWMLKNSDSLRFILQIYPTGLKPKAEEREDLITAHNIINEQLTAGKEAGIFRELPDAYLEESIFYQLVAATEHFQRNAAFPPTDGNREKIFQSVWRSVTN